MKNILTFVFAMIILIPSISFANPIPDSQVLDIRKLLLIFMIEPTIIFIALGYCKFKIIRFGVCWIGITLLTFALLIIIISTITSSTQNNIVASIIAEIVITVIEAVILQKLLTLKMLMKEPVNASFKKVILVSLAANASSLGVGYLVL